MTTNVTICASETTRQTLCARAPGKIILSGEHAVVYGADALAAAVKEYTTVTFLPVSQSRTINTIFSGISTGVTYPINALSKLKHHLDERFEQFTQGELPVQNILTHPNDLVMYTLMSLLQQLPSRETLKQFAPNSGVLRSDSTLPTGAGMGSSASAIAATLVLYEDILKKPLTAKQRFEMVRFCERLQHGGGSAIDAAAVTYGGINRVREHIPERVSITLDNHWYWLHTGKPGATTGECVQFVRKHYGNDRLLWQEFIAVTQAFEAALQQQRCPMDCLKENHRLLKRIGVVPRQAAELIAHIEQRGGAAKISGAGSVNGNKSGLVLMYLPVQDTEGAEEAEGIDNQFDNIFDNIRETIQQLNLLTGNYIKSWGKVEVDTIGATRLTTFNKDK